MMQLLRRIVLSMGAAMVIVGCAGSKDRPPTPRTASFDMRPVPKRERTSLFAAPAAAVRWISGNRPIRDVRMMENPNLPDQRRQGILALSSREYGQREPYTRRYRQIAQNDPDFLVRATAIRALNRSRDREAVPVFINALTDRNPQVRLQAVKALSNIPDASATEALMRVLGNQAEAKDVRIAAAEALRHYADVAVARVLAGTLEGRDFSIAWQSRWSLRILTGRDFHYNEQEWLNYLTAPENPLG